MAAKLIDAIPMMTISGAFMKWIIVTLMAALMSGCGADNALTKQEKEIQSKADIAVSEILFDYELDQQASYHTRRSGHVEIEFTQSVKPITYTLAVEKMRNHPDIKSVYAVQSGSEVCVLR